jgi:hypothetical protein
MFHLVIGHQWNLGRRLQYIGKRIEAMVLMQGKGHHKLLHQTFNSKIRDEDTFAISGKWAL